MSATGKTDAAGVNTDAGQPLVATGLTSPRGKANTQPFVRGLVLIKNPLRGFEPVSVPFDINPSLVDTPLVELLGCQTKLSPGVLDPDPLTWDFT